MTVPASTTPGQLFLWPLVALLLVGCAASANAAGSQSDFETAYAAADAAEQEAGRLRNRWTVTETALAGARKAAGAGDFDHAMDMAREAEALAKASVFQSKSEKEAWKNLEIR
jgi:hypothetical protein